VDDGAESFLDGCRAGAVWGTSWHGVLEEDALRRAFLREVASLAGVDGFEVSARTRFAARREERIERLADAVVRHLDTGALRGLVDLGAPAGLPFVPPGAPT
jgi:adenosylcobyric acid synthase